MKRILFPILLIAVAAAVAVFAGIAASAPAGATVTNYNSGALAHL